MRRSILALALSVLCVALTPVSAHAFFWKWLDDLSGPQFAGLSLELKRLCMTQSDAARKEMLRAVKRRLEVERLWYERRAMISSEPAAIYYRIGGVLTELALEKTEDAISAFAPPSTTPGSASDKAKPSIKERVDTAMAEVDNLRVLARAATGTKISPELRDKDFDWLEEKLETLSKLVAKYETSIAGADRSSPKVAEAFGILHADVQGSLGSIPRSVERSSIKQRALGGASGSVCNFSYYDQDRAFVSGTAGFGWDTKNANQGKGNMMATVGASAHWVIVPAVTIGAGGGAARFFVGSRKDFWKLYVQPVIIDVKPLTLYFWNPRFRSPWAHTVYVRYSGTTFPAGFKAGQFEADQLTYKAEYINSIGIYFDTEPLFRGRQRKWWRDHP